MAKARETKKRVEIRSERDERRTVFVNPARVIVSLKNGRVLIRPVVGSTTESSNHSQPGWFSSDPP